MGKIGGEVFAFQRVYEQDTVVNRRELRGSLPENQLKEDLAGTGGMVLEFRSHSINAWSIGGLQCQINGYPLTNDQPYKLAPGFRGTLLVATLEFTIEVEEHLNT